MIIINTVSQQRFSLDGIEYFKNFLSKVNGNKITIYNAYDSCDVLVEVELYSNITLNGVVYGSVILLQQALLPVIYTRDSLNGLISQSSLFNYFNNVEGFSLVGQNLTINTNWAWTINGTPYGNISSVIINVPLSEVGYHRLDIVVANQNNTFELIQGVQVLLANSPAEPPVPNGKLRATSLLVTEGTVGNPVNPSVGASQNKGNYNALTNTPSLVNGIGNIGDYYTVTVAGNGYEVNDRIEYNGSVWFKAVDNNQNAGINFQEEQITANIGQSLFILPTGLTIRQVLVGYTDVHSTDYVYNSSNGELTITAPDLMPLEENGIKIRVRSF